MQIKNRRLKTSSPAPNAQEQIEFMQPSLAPQQQPPKDEQAKKSVTPKN